MTKLLVVSNFFPPYKIGGYELLCKEVTQALLARGYKARILTSTYGVDRPMIEGDIYRWLTLENDLNFYSIKRLWTYPVQRSRNAKILRRMVLDYQPEVVFFWGLWALSKNVAQEAEKLMGNRVIYYFANPWPIQESFHKAYWESEVKNPWRSGIKKILRIPVKFLLKEDWSRVSLNYPYSPVCSQALKEQLLEAGIPLKNVSVIYEGINLPAYREQAAQRRLNNPIQTISLLYVGILAPHKGVHTAIEALAVLEPQVRDKFHLTVLGTGHPEYEAHLRNLVKTYQLGASVTFHEPIPRGQLPGFLGKHDVLVLPSIWEEPLALIMQEGLASGMVVVGSATGGTKEIIRNDENGLLFPAGDQHALARQLGRLVFEPSLMQRLSEQGQKTAEEKFDLQRMVAEMDHLIQEVVLKENAPAFHN